MGSLPTILVVEDEPLVRDLVVTALADEGYGLVQASSLDAAIRELEKAEPPFAAVITDIKLSRHASGWDVAHKARELHPSIGVIYMSADAVADWAANGVPGSVMIPKPFALSQVTTALANLLNIDRPG